MKFEETDKTKADLHFLQGVCYGIMADGDINKYEIELQKKWLNENKYLRDTYPFNEISVVVENAIDHGQIDQEKYKFLV